MRGQRLAKEKDRTALRRAIREDDLNYKQIGEVQPPHRSAGDSRQRCDQFASGLICRFTAPLS